MRREGAEGEAQALLVQQPFKEPQERPLGIEMGCIPPRSIHCAPKGKDLGNDLGRMLQRHPEGTWDIEKKH